MRTLRIRMRRIGAIIAYSVIGLSIGLSSHLVQGQRVGDRVAVIKTDAEIKIGSRVIGTAHRGDVLKVKSVKKRWLGVAHDGESGWIRNEDVLPVDEAISAITKEIQSAPQSAMFYLARGKVREALEDDDLAIVDYTMALQLARPEDIRIEAYNNRGRVWFKQHKFALAAADLAEITRIEPNNAEAWYAAARQLVLSDPYGVEGKGSPREAVQFARQACYLSGHRNWQHLDVLALAYALADQPAVAVVIQEEAVKLAPDEEKGTCTEWLEKFRAAADMTPYERAISNYSEAIRGDSTNPNAYRRRGEVYAMTEQYAKAIEDFSQAITLGASDASIYSLRGAAYAGEQQIAEAIADFSQAIELGARDLNIHSLRGQFYMAQGQYGKALDDFTECLRIRPQSTSSANNLAWLLATCPEAKYRDGKRAVEMAVQACELTNWRDFTCLDTLAAAYAEDHQFSEAVKYQEKTLALWPEDRTAGKTDAEKRLELYRNEKPFRETPPADGVQQ